MENIESDPKQNISTYHVLALSGGGYRALYSATILTELERVIGCPIAQKFDLICGTSAGGLLALGLASEIPAEKLKETFEKDGKKIFGQRSWLRKMTGFWFRAKHSNEGLKGVLSDLFEGQTFSHLKHRVLIPTVNFTTGKGQFFKTPHHPTFEMDRTLSLKDAALSTSAAPVYFPLYRNSRGVFVDGGLVGNAPGLFGVHEIQRFIANPNHPICIRVLSIGTLTIGATIRGDALLDQGIIGWKSGLFDLVISAQESSVDYMLKHILQDDYFKIDDQVTPDQSKDVRALDLVTAASTNTLRDRGMSAAQRALGDPKFAAFRNHQPSKPVFYGN